MSKEKENGSTLSEMIEKRFGSLLNDVVKVDRNYAVDNNAEVQALKEALRKAINKAYFADKDCQKDNLNVSFKLLEWWLSNKENADTIRGNISRYVFDENGYTKRGVIREGIPAKMELFVIDSVATAVQWMDWCQSVRETFNAKVRKTRQSTTDKAVKYVRAARSFRSLSQAIHLVCVRKNLDEKEIRDIFATEIKRARTANAAMIAAKKRTNN